MHFKGLIELSQPFSLEFSLKARSYSKRTSRSLAIRRQMIASIRYRTFSSSSSPVCVRLNAAFFVGENQRLILASLACSSSQLLCFRLRACGATWRPTLKTRTMTSKLKKKLFKQPLFCCFFLRKHSFVAVINLKLARKNSECRAKACTSAERNPERSPLASVGEKAINVRFKVMDCKNVAAQK